MNRQIITSSSRPDSRKGSRLYFLVETSGIARSNAISERSIAIAMCICASEHIRSSLNRKKPISIFIMPILQFKGKEPNDQFLYEAPCSAEMDDVTKAVVRIHNKRLRLKYAATLSRELATKYIPDA